ncbi:hypothetical protein RI054_04g22310 [Pseudoscourfieldia marina]
MPVSAINAPGQWDVFLSHTRRNDAAVGLAEKMFRSLEKNHELGIWLDVEMPKRDEAAMVEGASNCDMLIAIVTKGPKSPDYDYLKRDFCLKELRAAKAAGVAIQPVVRVEDKHRINEFFADLPDDLTYLRGVDVIDLNRNDADYWNVGMQKVVDRLNEAKSAKTREANQATNNGMHADALQLLQGMHLDKYADALFEMGVVTKEDLSLVDEDIMSEVGFSTLEKKKFLKRRPPSARPTSRAPDSSISTVRRGQAAIDNFKARANWRKVANVRDAATRLQTLSVDAKAKTLTSEAAIESIKEAKGRNNVHAIIETMKLNVADADVQQEACRALGNLSAKTDENRTRIGKMGGIEAVVSAMKRHEDLAGVQEQACRALGNLSINDENQSRIAQAGGIEAVLRAMKRHENHAGVQEYACRAFEDLSRDNLENQSRIRQAGGIEAVVLAMKRHQDHAGVQEYACRAFINLSAMSENRTRIGQAGGIEAVVSVMKRHENHADLQENACWVLGILSYDNPENQSRIAQVGGIVEAVVSAMKRHENHADLQEYACIVFYYTSSNAECKRRAIDAGAIPAIEVAIRNQSLVWNDELQRWGKDALDRLRS